MSTVRKRWTTTWRRRAPCSAVWHNLRGPARTSVGPQRLFRGDRIVSKQWMRVAMLVVAGQFCAQATVPVHVSATGVYTDGREVAPPDGSSPPPSRFGEVVRSFPTPTGYATGIAWDG